MFFTSQRVTPSHFLSSGPDLSFCWANSGPGPYVWHRWCNNRNEKHREEQTNIKCCARGYLWRARWAGGGSAPVCGLGETRLSWPRNWGWTWSPRHPRSSLAPHPPYTGCTGLQGAEQQMGQVTMACTGSEAGFKTWFQITLQWWCYWSNIKAQIRAEFSQSSSFV